MSGDEDVADVEVHGRRSSSAAMYAGSSAAMQASSMLSTFTSVLRGAKSYSTSVSPHACLLVSLLARMRSSAHSTAPF